MNNPEILGFCGVDCSGCSDFALGKCPSCRKTEWTEDDICRPVQCCREKEIDLCGQCAGFPCGMMAEFYEESDSHSQAGERMRKIKNNCN